MTALTHACTAPLSTAPPLSRRVAAACALAAALAASLPARAADAVSAGVQRQSWTVARADGGSDSVPGLVFYPTAAAASRQQWGPFAVDVAPGGAPLPGRHPLVIVSHGTGGHELGHAWLAQRLAAEGYVVATLRHPGDNFEDRSGVASRDYLVERPRQVSRVLDALLADPRWAPLIDTGRIAAVGHSAGGHSVLALAGATVDRQRLLEHCSAQGSGLRDDAVMCGLGGFSAARPAPVPSPAAPTAQVRDARIRAVVAAAPLTAALAPASWATLPVPVKVVYGGRDTVLPAPVHAEPLCRALPAGACLATPEAGHFALFQPGTGRLGAPGMDPAEDPEGFDRRAWQQQAWPVLRDFLRGALGDAGPGAP